MSKLRTVISIIKTKNYIVITDDINDGYVEPHAAHSFLAEVEPILEHLKQTGREYNLQKDVKL